MIEGSDPQLRNEYVLVSAHFDHEGAEGRGSSTAPMTMVRGRSALFEIAEAYALAAKSGPGAEAIGDFRGVELRGARAAGRVGLHGKSDRAARSDRRRAQYGHDRPQRRSCAVGGGGRFRGLELQTAESNANATNIIGTLRSPDLRAALEKANQEIGLELKFRYDNNVSNLMRRSDHWPFIQTWRPRRLGPHRLSSRLPHDLRPPRKDQLREDGKDCAGGLPGGLGSGEHIHAPAASMAPARGTPSTAQ